MTPGNLFDQLDLSLPGLAAVAAAVGKKDLVAASSALLAYFRSRRMTYHFDPDAPMRDLDAIPSDPLDQTPLAAVMTHDFSLAGCPPAACGPMIDWRRETDYLQWHCQLCRQPFWLTLAEGWRRTGEPRYVAELAAQLKSWDEQVPPHFPAEGVVRAIDPGIRLTHWMRLFPVVVKAGPFDAATLVRFLSHVHGACEYLNAHGAEGYCPGNHGVFEAMGVLQSAVYLPEFKAATRWRSGAAGCIGSRILADVRADGGHVEQSTSYHADMLGYFLTFWRLLELSGETPEPAVRERLSRMLTFLAALRMPDGNTAPLGDSHPAARTDLLLRGADLLQRPDVRYIATAGQSGARPAWTDLVFRDSGLAVLRGSHDDAQARWLLFDTGAHGGWHGHYDLLQVAVGAFGRSFLVDPGCGRYDHQWRPLMRGTLMHNTVSVDFHDYLDEGALDTAAPSRGTLARADLSGPLKVLSGWHDGYSTPRERIVVERRVLMIRGRYWIVADRVRAGQLHEFASAWHFAPGLLRPLPGFPGMSTTFPDANLAVVPVFGKARFSTLPRWTVPESPGDVPSPVWVAEGVGRDWLFAAALIPYRGMACPLAAISLRAAPGGFTVRIDWTDAPGDEVTLVFGEEPGSGSSVLEP